MEGFTFNFEVNGKALVILNTIVDKYIEEWPGGQPQEQEELKAIQLGLRQALLDYQLNCE